MYFFSRLLNNRNMKTIEEIHRQNLALLVRQYKTVSAAADAVGCSSSQFSQWLNASENSGTGKPRGISTGSCRKIEAACGKPVGWMDMEHDSDFQTGTSGDPHATHRPAHVQWVGDDEAEILDAYRSTDEDGRKIIALAAKSVFRLPLRGIVNNKL